MVGGRQMSMWIVTFGAAGAYFESDDLAWGVPGGAYAMGTPIHTDHVNGLCGDGHRFYPAGQAGRHRGPQDQLLHDSRPALRPIRR